MHEWKQRVAVITGGGSGIGEALAHACADRGMRVAVADVESEAAQRVAEAVRSRGGEALGWAVDVGNREAVTEFAAGVRESFGACHLLCNNAGVLVTRPLLEIQAKDWEWCLSVNLWGAIHSVSAFVPGMLESGDPGHVVNTASIVGLVPIAQGNLGAYTTTKFALVGFSESLRAELQALGAPIGVSVVCPGAVTTRIAESERNRPSQLQTGPAQVPPEADPNASPTPGKQSSEAVAASILAGVENDETWILTHPEMKPLVAGRTAALLEAFDRAALQSPG
ncbi:MAG: SDR family NAD(P)-dependent oxidoreductase [Myxococcota bacterium]|nr:SDR family NAD(P)-dependent oxidoreductase [Myxococcota bacterium]